MSKEEFKIFAKSHPELVEFIKSGNMTWQKFYEIYDIYGSDANAWSPYIESKKNTSINNFSNILGSLNTDNLKKHIDTAQKAIGVVQELASKGKATEGLTNLTKGPINPRPINKFFED